MIGINHEKGYHSPRVTHSLKVLKHALIHMLHVAARYLASIPRVWPGDRTGVKLFLASYSYRSFSPE